MDWPELDEEPDVYPAVTRSLTGGAPLLSAPLRSLEDQKSFKDQLEPTLDECFRTFVCKPENAKPDMNEKMVLV